MKIWISSKKALSEADSLKTRSGIASSDTREAISRHKKLSEHHHAFLEHFGTASEIHHSRRSKKLWAHYKDKRSGMSRYVSDLLSAPDDQVAFAKLLKGDGHYLAVVRQGLPHKDRARLAEAIIAYTGHDKGKFNILKAQHAFDQWDPPLQAQFLKTPPLSARKPFLKSCDLIRQEKEALKPMLSTARGDTAPLDKLLHKYVLPASTVGLAAFAPHALWRDMDPLILGHASGPIPHSSNA